MFDVVGLSGEETKLSLLVKLLSKIPKGADIFTLARETRDSSTSLSQHGILVVGIPSTAFFEFVELVFCESIFSSKRT